MYFIYFPLFLQAYADALLVIPKILAQNSGYDPQETIVKLQVNMIWSAETTSTYTVSTLEYFESSPILVVQWTPDNWNLQGK